MITLKQLAELSGYSVRTVQRVLTGQAHVMPEKRERILALAKQHQYVPNMAARSLRLQKKNFVGIVFEDFNISASVHKLNCLDSLLVENGYFPMLGNIGEQNGFPIEQLLANWAGVTDYVVVFGGLTRNTGDRFRNYVERYPMKFIFVDAGTDDLGVSINVDRSGSVYDMIVKLDAMGYRHLLYCGSLETRKKGVEKAEEDSGIKMKISRIQMPEKEFSAGEKIGDAVMASGADVVFFDTDRQACGFYRYAAKHHVEIPGQIAVVGFDNDPFADLLNPPLATLAHPAQELAQEVLEVIRTGTPAERKPLKMRFLPRESVSR
ncbi:MAG: LacI family DNA-binding transcriptional regulator [Lentisphaeria bacterium]|nr:LacI family DNA-binding transcriptional regulator [Lentisphaeria bacterium]